MEIAVGDYIAIRSECFHVLYDNEWRYSDNMQPDARGKILRIGPYTIDVLWNVNGRIRIHLMPWSQFEHFHKVDE